MGLAGGSIAAAETALHERADEDRALVDCSDVADEDATEARGKRGCVVADLVGVREDEVVGRLGGDELLERGGVTVGGVGREERVLDADDFADAFCCGFGGESFGLRADDDGGGLCAGLRGEDCWLPRWLQN